MSCLTLWPRDQMLYWSVNSRKPARILAIVVIGWIKDQEGNRKENVPGPGYSDRVIHNQTDSVRSLSLCAFLTAWTWRCVMTRWHLTAIIVFLSFVGNTYFVILCWAFLLLLLFTSPNCDLLTDWPWTRAHEWTYDTEHLLSILWTIAKQQSLFIMNIVHSRFPVTVILSSTIS